MQDEVLLNGGGIFHSYSVRINIQLMGFVILLVGNTIAWLSLVFSLIINYKLHMFIH